MTPSGRWVTVNGQQQLRIVLPGGQSFTVDTETAWELIGELRWCLMANLPGKPDHGEGED